MSKKIKFVGYCEMTKTLDFRFENGEYFSIKSFKDGVLELEPVSGENLSSFAKKVASCFKKKSKFYGLKAIKFEFNDIPVKVTIENAKVEEIVKIWNENWNEKYCHGKT